MNKVYFEQRILNNGEHMFNLIPLSASLFSRPYYYTPPKIISKNKKLMFISPDSITIIFQELNVGLSDCIPNIKYFNKK